MLELNDLSLFNGSGDNEQIILHEISAQFPDGHFTAILGPSVSGNSTLLRLIAGIGEASMGGVNWDDPAHGTDGASAPHAIGFIPQCDFTRDYLSVRESIEDALRLRVTGLDADDRQEQSDKILLEVGLVDVADQQARFLSPAQKARLKLGIELVNSPKVLLCDHIGSGLDPKAEHELLKLLRQISMERKCLTLLVTGNLRHLSLFNTLFVLHEGHLAYHGPGEFLFHYFNVENPEELFPRLSQRKAGEWHSSWAKHRTAYYSAQTDGYQVVKSSEEEPEEALPGDKPEGDEDAPKKQASKKKKRAVAPGGSAFTQMMILLVQRWKALARNRTQLLLQLTFLLGLPCLVVVFGWQGLSKIVNPATSGSAEAAGTGALVSALVMFQAILLTFAGAVNGAAEIAGERAILEKEKFAGLRPVSYIASKALFLLVLAAGQSLWMAFFVRGICHFPGDFLVQALTLFCVNAAMTAICLGISALSSSPERAKLVALFIVAIQLPFSGTILALPAVLSRIARPLDTAYWGWSGVLRTFVGHYELGAGLKLFPVTICLCVLGTQILLGLCLALLGTKRNAWAKP